MTSKNNTSDAEFSELEADFDSFLGIGENAVNALESSVPAGGVPVLSAPIQERVEASSTLKRAKKLIPPGKSGLRNRIIRKVLKKAGITNVPQIDSLFCGKAGYWVPIKEITLFTSQPRDELLVELAKESCPKWNRINCVDMVVKRMVEVGVQIFRDGRMYTPIQVAQVEDNVLECISGRHRLAFFVMIYGGDCKVPIYVESMTLDVARHAVAVANDCRPVKALEHAEHAALSAVGGNVDAEQDELYRKIARSKNNIKKYCVYSVIKRGYPTELDFGASQVPSPVGSDITTVSNLESYWGASLEWNKDILREDFDAALVESTSFLNRLSHMFRNLKGFVPKRHMSATVLTAIGRYYNDYADANGIDTIASVETLDDEYINRIAVMIVTMEDIENNDENGIYARLIKAFTHL
jgi:hypothetical protein